MERLIVYVSILLLQQTTSISGDISGTNPPVDSCLCPNIRDLIVRDSPCGNQVNVIGFNDCGKYTGQMETCTTDLEYDFYQFHVRGQTVWAIGNYLNDEPSYYCATHPCGVASPQPSETDERIIGGMDAVRGMYPWHLMLDEDDGNGFKLICGAALIDDHWAVTAAHCVYNKGALRLVAGVYDRTDMIAPDQIRSVASNQITIYPSFDPQYLNYDIAIIHIQQGFDLSNSAIGTICLPPDADFSYINNPACYLTGWGITEVNGTSMPQILQRTGTDVIGSINCELGLGRPPMSSHTCTLDQATHAITPCTNDMGGPLSCAVNTRFHLAGIGSFTDPDCRPIIPQIYAKVPYFVDWIRQVTGLP